MDHAIQALIKKSFISGCIKVRSVNPATGEVSWSPVSGVFRHETPHKRFMRVQAGGATVGATEDHSLFQRKDDGLDQISPKDLQVGDEIVVVRGDSVSSATVESITEEACRKHTYDLSVPSNENFVLASGVLAHNTYSISGVSLDIEKSSKYQGMKDNFEQQYDKLKEEIKRSIKIVKGLQQPRYGIGISSALGPFSKVGVQSRRNYISSM